jgi:hypothetical protein
MHGIGCEPLLSHTAASAKTHSVPHQLKFSYFESTQHHRVGVIGHYTCLLQQLRHRAETPDHGLLLLK